MQINAANKSGAKYARNLRLDLRPKSFKVLEVLDPQTLLEHYEIMPGFVNIEPFDDCTIIKFATRRDAENVFSF